MTPDAELLRDYAEQGSEAAFAEIVRRYMNLVYATALRLANHNAPLAEDVAQTVFTDLARKAEELRSHSTLAGWLHTSAYYAATKAIRGEQRRHRREQEASIMNGSTAEEMDNSWMQLRPVLDEAVNQLSETERDAVLLRFFQDKTYREVGVMLNLTEEGARIRVQRGLEKLRDQFVRRGIVATVTLLTSTLGARAASMVAPTNLAVQVAQKSLLEAGAIKTGGVAAKYWGSKTTVALVGASAGMAAMAAVFVYAFAPARPVASGAPERSVSNPPAAPAKISSNPNNPMTTTQVLSAGAVAATLLTSTPAVATTTSELVSTGQNVASSVVQQTPPNADSSSAPTSNNNGSSTSAPPSTDAPVKTAAAISNGLVGIAEWGRWATPIYPIQPGLVDYSASPTLVDTTGVLKGKTITAVAGGSFFKLALCADGTLAAWNDNSAGQLGIGPAQQNVKNSRVPVLVDLSAMTKKKVIAIAAGGAHAEALCADGSVYQWGGGIVPLPGSKPPVSDERGPDLSKKTPTLFAPDVLGGRKVIALASGTRHCLALCSDGALICWGSYFNQGILPMLNMGSPRSQPVRDIGKMLQPHVANDQGLLKDKKIIAIAAGNSKSLVLCSDGTLAQFGEGVYAEERAIAEAQKKQLAASKLTDARLIGAPYREYAEKVLKLDPVPVDTSGVLAGKTIKAIAISGSTDLVLCTDGTLATWGSESNGEFGDGSESQMSPDPILVDTSGVLSRKTATAITSISGGFLALCSDGTLVAWGSGAGGQLGDGNSGEKYFSPVPVLVDRSGVLNGKKILAITNGAVLFK